jgi:hypothetical protein
VGPPLSRTHAGDSAGPAYHAARCPAVENRRNAGLFASTLSYSRAIGMGAHPNDSTAGPAGGRLGADLATHVEAIVHAAEREARAAEQAIAAHRRSAEEEVARYLAAARLHVDAETAARSARIETLSAAARRLSDELTDAVAALTRELHSDQEGAAMRLPRPPWPAEPAPVAAAPPPAPPAPAPVTPEPTWTRAEAPEPSTPEPEPVEGTSRVNGNGDTADELDIPAPSAARLVAIEMAVGGSSRAEVEEHLRVRLGVTAPEPLLDDVFGVASHAGSRLAWGEP